MSAPKTISQEALLEELKQIEAAKQNPQRFGVLYEKYYKQIFLFVYKRTGDEDTCGDVTSQVFLKAMLALPKFEYKGVPFSAWLYRIASNEVSQHFRDQKKERSVSIEKDGVERVLAAVAEEEGSDLVDEFREALLETLEELSESDLQLIEMRYFEKRPFQEVAYILGLSETNAKVRCGRILMRMRKKMEEKRSTE
ncbi:MAG: sigma-70 family RNA polymerase sigma factor [Bacteroidia bacterium]|nr:sigma-70 family RNA polymerase sigma factor [Bacteroidia bacterium]